MKGNPIKEWIVFSVLWLLLLIPVIKLTVSRKNTAITIKPHSETAAAETTTSATTILRYTETPLSVKITQNNRTLCDLSNLSPAETELELPLLIKDYNTEFLLQVKWSNDNRHVFEIELFVEDKEAQMQHYWTEQELNEAVRFSWQQKAWRRLTTASTNELTH